MLKTVNETVLQGNIVAKFVLMYVCVCVCEQGGSIVALFVEWQVYERACSCLIWAFIQLFFFF